MTQNKLLHILLFIVLAIISACSSNDTSTTPRSVTPSPPSINITSPSTSGNFSTVESIIDLQGMADFDNSAPSISISCTNNDITCTGTIAGTTNWSITGVVLVAGINDISITVTSTNSDNSTQSAVAGIIVTYTPPPNTPEITISQPSTNNNYTHNASSITIGGTASEDVNSISWNNDRGGSGTITGNTNWQIADIALSSGNNAITVTADNGERQSVDAINVLYQAVLITSPSDTGTFSTSNNTINLAGSAASDINALSWQNDRGGSGDISVASNWQFNNINLLDGINTITVTATANGRQFTDTLEVTLTTPSGIVHSSFTQTLTDNPTINEVAPWGKNMGDIDGDGDLDIALGGGGLGNGGPVYWYENPNMTRSTLGNIGGGDDLKFVDINADGAVDVVVNRDNIIWYENPRGNGGDPKSLWTQHIIAANSSSHDLQISDMNNDGKLDVVIRKEFRSTHLYLQTDTPDWTQVNFSNAPDGEGTALVDLNRDGRKDIVANGYWLEQPQNLESATWPKHDFTTWKAAADVRVVDINKDGRLDIFLSDSETGPGKMAWFEGPVNVLDSNWTEHIIDPDVEDVHRLHVVDMNNDGKKDLVFAEMHQSPKKRLAIYYNTGLGVFENTPQVLYTNGGHNIAVDDVDHDGDMDILAANWSKNAADGGRVNLWINEWNSSLSLDKWTEIEIDTSKTGRVFGLNFADINGDNRLDIFTGQYWYANPGGDLNANWARTDIGSSVSDLSNIDAMLAMDIDNDNQMDLIAETTNGSSTEVGVYWLSPNDTSGSLWTNKLLIGKIPADADDGTSQGYRLGQIVSGGLPEIVLSSVGVFYFQVPVNPLTDPWPKITIATNAKEEGIALGDIDNDGDIDVAGIKSDGTTISWWENPNNGLGNWTAHDIGVTNIVADRVELADINRNGKLDIVVSETDNSANLTNNLYVFSQPADLTSPNWPKATANTGKRASLNSMDVADLNLDGLPDIVTGEHGCSTCTSLKTTVWENNNNGSSWIEHTVNNDVNKTIESHLGTRLVDLDNDGDLDMVSIGWYKNNVVRIWRNDAIVN